jgi:hypothetical protein
MKNLISTPIQFPYVVPVDWHQWWDLWYKENKIVAKVGKNHNHRSVLWKGFDIYVKPGVDSIKETKYDARNLNCIDLFPSIFDNLHQLPLEVEIVRAVSSIGPVLPHQDQAVGNISVRSMLYDNNVRNTFYYTVDNINRYQELPLETNTWMYWDNKVMHGTDWYMGHSKILIMYFGKTKLQEVDTVIEQSKKLYSNYIIYNE